MTKEPNDRPKAPRPSNGKVERAFLCEKDAATYLGMSVGWMRKCRDLGTGPRWAQFEGAIRYPIEGLLEYVRKSSRDFTGQRSHPNETVPKPSS